MEPLFPLLTTVLPILYALSCAAYARAYAREGSSGARLGPGILLGAVSVHVIYLAARGVEVGHLPLATAYDFLSATSLSLALVYLYVEARQRTPATGIFVLPFVLLTQFVASAYGTASGPAPPMKPIWFEVHTVSALLGTSAFAVSAIYGVLFLALYRDIKASRLSLFFRRMPPLETLAQMNIRAAGAGLAFLTVTIVLGVGWIERSGKGSLTDPKVWLTLGVWLIFAFAVLAYHRLGWRGPRAVYVSLIGFTTLLVSRVAVDVFLHSFHAFR
jgi:HemX protein